MRHYSGKVALKKEQCSHGKEVIWDRNLELSDFFLFLIVEVKADHHLKVLLWHL